MRGNATLFDARDQFALPPPDKHERLSAIIITDTGTDRGKPVGIVTPWDLVRMPA
jgi:hypothetical protein